MSKRLYLIVLEKWIPAIIAGLFVAIIVPWMQSHYAALTVLEQRKHDLWRSIGENFTGYHNAYVRLNLAVRERQRQEQNGQKVSKEFSERIEQYRQERDKFNTELNQDLVMAEYYYGPSVAQIVRDYRSFKDKIKIAPIAELPPSEELIQWRVKLMTGIRADLE